MKTKVIFRRFKNITNDNKDTHNEIVAIFPQLPGDSSPRRTCLSYMHIGQHGAITVNYAKFTTELTYRPDYQELYDELISLGYDLEVCTRMTHADTLKRIAEMEK